MCASAVLQLETQLKGGNLAQLTSQVCKSLTQETQISFYRLLQVPKVTPDQLKECCKGKPKRKQNSRIMGPPPLPRATPDTSWSPEEAQPPTFQVWGCPTHPASPSLPRLSPANSLPLHPLFLTQLTCSLPSGPTPSVVNLTQTGTLTSQPTETAQTDGKAGNRIQLRRKLSWKPGQSHQNCLTGTSMHCGFHSSCTLGSPGEV